MSGAETYCPFDGAFVGGVFVVVVILVPGILELEGSSSPSGPVDLSGGHGSLTGHAHEADHFGNLYIYRKSKRIKESEEKEREKEKERERRTKHETW